MRRKVVFFLLINIFVVSVLLASFWPLICLLFLDGADDAISRAELPAPNSEMIEGLPQLIPKIIHQTWINTGMPSPENGTYTSTPIPEVWRAAQESCMKIHDDYEYKVGSADICVHCQTSADRGSFGPISIHGNS